MSILLFYYLGKNSQNFCSQKPFTNSLIDLVDNKMIEVGKLIQ